MEKFNQYQKLYEVLKDEVDCVMYYDDDYYDRGIQARDINRDMILLQELKKEY